MMIRSKLWFKIKEESPEVYIQLIRKERWNVCQATSTLTKYFQKERSISERSYRILWGVKSLITLSSSWSSSTLWSSLPILVLILVITKVFQRFSLLSMSSNLLNYQSSLFSVLKSSWEFTFLLQKNTLKMHSISGIWCSFCCLLSWLSLISSSQIRLSLLFPELSEVFLGLSVSSLSLEK